MIDYKGIDEAWESYFYPGTDVFKNKLGIQSKEDLMRVDAQKSLARLVELRINPIKGNFDKEHLKKIHFWLFQDLYDWAGEYRSVYMAKNGSYFAPVKDIDQYLDNSLNIMNQNIKNVNNLRELAVFIADIYIALQNIHPFREGNGRAIKEFISEFIEEKTKDIPSLGQHTINWGELDNELMDMAMQNARVFPSIIEMQFAKIIHPVNCSVSKIKNH